MTEPQKRAATWGGARTGAGRPAEDLVLLKVQVRPDQLAWLDRVQAVAGEKSRAETVRRLLDEARRVQALREHLASVLADTAYDPAAGDVLDGKGLAQHVLDLLDGASPIEESTPDT